MRHAPAQSRAWTAREEDLMRHAPAPAALQLEHLQRYAVEGNVLRRCKERLARGHGALTPKSAMELAVELQVGQSDEDEAWLRAVGVPPELIPTVRCRMNDRGAAWLQLLETVVGYEGDYSEF